MNKLAYYYARDYWFQADLLQNTTFILCHSMFSMWILQCYSYDEYTTIIQYVEQVYCMIIKTHQYTDIWSH